MGFWLLYCLSYIEFYRIFVFVLYSTELFIFLDPYSSFFALFAEEPLLKLRSFVCRYAFYSESTFLLDSILCP